MGVLFLKIFNLSITASWLVLTVVILRLLLRKAPKAISCALWMIVALRLALPFSLDSVLSLVPSAETIPSDFTTTETPQLDSGFYEVNNVINPIITETLANQGNTVEPPAKSLADNLAVVWSIGVALMLMYMLVSYVRVRLKVREAVPIKDKLMICDHVGTPFILGVIRPRIYLPSELGESDSAYVIEHEMAHLARLDHLWKPLGFLLLSVYWFNPILWLAYVLLCRDIELACDERVIRKLGGEIKKPYSDALVNCSMPRRMISACPLAFGEVGVNGRIKAVLNYKKPAFWVIIVATVAVVITAVCFLTNPEKLPDNDPTPPDREVAIGEVLTKALRETIISENESDCSEANYSALDYTVLDVNENINTVTIYAVVMYREYNSADGKLTVEYETHLPTTVVFRKYDADYALVSYTTPTGNEKYPEGFPESLKGDADPKAYEEKHAGNCLALAKQYFKMTDEEPRYTATIEEFFYLGETEVFDTAVFATDYVCLHIIDSIEGVHDYLTIFNPRRDSHIASFLEQKEADITEHYPAEFFENNVLMFVYLWSGCPTEYVVENIYNDGERFAINVVVTGNGVIDVMCADIITIPVPKKDIETCAEFSVTLENEKRHSETYKAEHKEEGVNKVSFKLFVPENPYGYRNFYLSIPSLSTHGSYEIKDGYLYLYALRGYTYVFKDLDGNRYAYDASRSNAKPDAYEIEDGTVFVLTLIS